MKCRCLLCILLFCCVALPSLYADYALAPGEVQLQVSKGGNHTLPRNTLFRIVKYEGAFCLVNVVGRDLRGYVRKDAVHIVAGNLPDAEEAFHEALEALRNQSLNKARTFCIIAEPQAPEYTSVYRGLRDQIEKLDRAVYRIQDAHETVRTNIEKARQNAINAQRIYTAPTFKDDRRAEAGKSVHILNRMKDAQGQVEEAQAAIYEAARGLASAINDGATYAQLSYANGQYDVAMRLDECLRAITYKHLPGATYHPALSIEAMRKALEIDTQVEFYLKQAVASRKLGKLEEATRMIGEALGVMGNHRKANVMYNDIRRLRERIDVGLPLVDEMMAAGQYDQAARALAAVQTVCTDNPHVNGLISQVRSQLAQRQSLLAEADFQVKVGQYEKAYKTYRMYGEQQRLAAMLPDFAKAMEEKGNFLRAYELYEQARMEEDARRIAQLVQPQKEAYAAAKMMMADQRFDEALQHVSAFNDQVMIESIMSQKAAYLESRGDYETALACWREMGSADNVSRINALVASRTKALAEARNMERAGRLLDALERYSSANEPKSVRRLAAHLGANAERNGEPGTAVEFYELAELWDVAGRLRREAGLSAERTDRVLTAEMIYERCAPATVSIISEMANQQMGLGSGFFVSPNGYLLTNNHVISGHKQIMVVTPSNESYPAEVVATNRAKDIALLKIDKRGCPFLEMGSADSVKTGSRVYAIGTPQDLHLAQSFTDGIVSSRRKIEEMDCFQISVLINQGNSGGPLIDGRGRVIGINTMKLIGDNVEGINFAVTIDEARPLLSQIR